MFESNWRIGTIKTGDLAIFDRDAEPVFVETLSTDNPVRVRVPQFQRSLVWGRKKREDFFESLRKGYPFGIVTLADIGTVDGQRHFRLIDGLQRMTALRNFVANFLTWYRPTEDDTNDLIRAAELLGATLVPDDAEQFFVDWLKSRDGQNPFTAMNLVLRLADHVGSDVPLVQAEAASSLTQAITERIDAQQSSLLAIEIPVQIVGESLVPSLSEVFDKLNSNLQLSKYDLLAATLDTIPADLSTLGVSIEDRRALVQLANQRFDAAKTEGYDVELYEEDEETVTLFDYLYARSRWASNKYPSFSSRETELAFNVAALVFGRSLRALDAASASHFSVAFPRVAEGDEKAADIRVFDDAFREGAKAVHESLQQFVGWDLKKTNLVNPLGILQAATYVANFISLVFKVGPNSLDVRGAGAADSVLGSGSPSMTPAARRSAFRGSLHWWLLLDSLDRTFVGSDAYENTVRRTWRSVDLLDPGEEMLSRPPLDRLLLPMHDLFVSGLEVQRTPERRAALSGPASALMRYAFAARQGEIADSTLDHIYPIKWASESVEVEQPVALNHFANIAFVSASDNSGRKHRLFPDWLQSMDAPERAGTVDRLSPLVLLELDGLTAERATSADSYVTYLQERARRISMEAFRGLDPAYYEANESAIKTLVDQAMAPTISFAAE